MTVHIGPSRVSRRAVLKGGALTIAFALGGDDLFAQDGSSSPRILDPNHGCVRRIVVELVQLTGQADRILHSPENQRWNVHPE